MARASDELALLERVLRDDEPRPRRLQLHLLAHDVDAGDDASGALIVGKPHQGLGGSDLCLRRFHPRGVSPDLKIERADRKNDRFAHIAHVGLAGAHEGVAGPQAADRARVEERRRDADTGIEQAEGTDDRRQAWQREAERGSAECLIRTPHRSGHVRQELAQRVESRALRALELLFLNDDGQVLFEAAMDGICEGQVQRSGGRWARWHGAELNRRRLTLCHCRRRDRTLRRAQQ